MTAKKPTEDTPAHISEILIALKSVLVLCGKRTVLHNVYTNTYTSHILGTNIILIYISFVEKKQTRFTFRNQLCDVLPMSSLFNTHSQHIYIYILMCTLVFACRTQEPYTNQCKKRICEVSPI